jgi:hypothetical protein
MWFIEKSSLIDTQGMAVVAVARREMISPDRGILLA